MRIRKALHRAAPALVLYAAARLIGLLLPLAVSMARARPRAVVVTAGALAGLSCCYGAYLPAIAGAPP